jgi:hypothetical protein
VKLSPGGELLCSPLHTSKVNSKECSPLGVNEGVNIPPRGQSSPLWARGEVKNGPLKRFTNCSLGTMKSEPFMTFFLK